MASSLHRTATLTANCGRDWQNNASKRTSESAYIAGSFSKTQVFQRWTSMKGRQVSPHSVVDIYCKKNC